jgi:hypothetical protein
MAKNTNLNTTLNKYKLDFSHNHRKMGWKSLKGSTSSKTKDPKSSDSLPAHSRESDIKATESHKDAKGELPLYEGNAQASGTATSGTKEEVPSGPAPKYAKRIDSKGRPTNNSKFESFRTLLT